jgi:redox-sensitive bicupin YhaK (pirin superfamily)
MSLQECLQPVCTHASGAVATIIQPRPRDIGNFQVRRVLPAAAQRRIGPFVFFDEMGPAQLAAGQAMDVRPHPHIGLSTLTWLFEGEILHRDSLGYVQPIRPGEVNWMTAGRGIVHSERTPDHLRGQAHSMHGIQCWVALPDGEEDIAPQFQHYPGAEIPSRSLPGVTIQLVAGSGWGMHSPVQVHSKLCFAQVDMQAGRQLELADNFPERGVYIVAGQVEVADENYAPGRMLILESGVDSLRSSSDARMIIVAGEPLASDRILYWNFVARQRERIEQAKQDWREGRFDPVPGDDESIPLPVDQP